LSKAHTPIAQSYEPGYTSAETVNLAVTDWPLPIDREEEGGVTVTFGTSVGRDVYGVSLAVVLGPATDFTVTSTVADQALFTLIEGTETASSPTFAPIGMDTGFQVSPEMRRVAVLVSGVEAVGAN
jgi:hypothetical protein